MAARPDRDENSGSGASTPTAPFREPARAQHDDGPEQIPTIDLSLANDPSTLPILLSELRRAITEVGYLYLSNHDIPPRTVRNLVDVLPRLFALGTEAKREIALENSPHFLGYSAVGTETTGGRADRREQVECATELPATWRPGQPLCERLKGPNQWPSEIPELDPIVENYLIEMTWLGERFLTLVAQSLGLPRGTFLPYLSDQHRLKLVHYPPAPTAPPSSPAPLSSPSSPCSPPADPSSPPPDSTTGVGPHKDSSGWWTFLLQASPAHVGGLQVLTKSGAWLDVPPVAGTFVVFVGQAFEVVTHGACRATTHRVLLSPTSTPEGGRFSVPFFQGVRRDLRREEAVEALRGHFADFAAGVESEEARAIDHPFLRGGYDTYGEAQLRTKIRSHRVNGRKFYGEVYERYIQDDA